jgi:enamine deaminase RidA (YjgF/YER057c/UK114 family)
VRDIHEQLKQMGVDLPPAPKPIASYVPAKRAGNLVTTAGQVSALGDEVWKGKLGAERSVEEAQRATRASAINCLSALLTVIDSLNDVKQIVSVHGFVNSTPTSTDQAAAMNGASDFLVDVFGEAGKHARTAVGVSLPMDFTASVYMVVEI